MHDVVGGYVNGTRNDGYIAISSAIRSLKRVLFRSQASARAERAESLHD